VEKVFSVMRTKLKAALATIAFVVAASLPSLGSAFPIVAPCSGASRTPAAPASRVASQSLTRPARGAGGVGAASRGEAAEGVDVLRVYADALNVLRMLRPVLVEIGRADSDLARQLRRCASSMVLNIAEGSYARKGNKAALYAVALGSAKETRACLDVAEALGYVRAIEGEIGHALDGVCAVLFRLS